MGKEKKGLEDSLNERTEQLQASEDKVTNLNKAKNKLEAMMKEVNMMKKIILRYFLIRLYIPCFFKPIFE